MIYMTLDIHVMDNITIDGYCILVHFQYVCILENIPKNRY